MSAAAGIPSLLASNHFLPIPAAVLPQPPTPLSTRRLLHSPLTHFSKLTPSEALPLQELSSQISYLCSKGQLQPALETLDSAAGEGEDVEEEVLVELLRLCELRYEVSGGGRVYDYARMRVRGFGRRLGNALLSMFVRFGKLLDAWFVFGKMGERDLFSWNVMLGGYAKAGFSDEALSLYDRMLWVGVRPDVYTFPCVLRTCASVLDLGWGREVHAHVVRFGYESETDVLNALITMYAKCGGVEFARRVFDGMVVKDRISWNAMISGYFENEKCLEGLRLFLVMQNCSISPDLMTLTSLFSACDLLGDMDLGKTIQGYAVKMNFMAEVSVCNALIQLYVNAGMLNEAEQVFSRMGFRDLVSWTAMIWGYESRDMHSEAVDLYEEMILDGIQPDEFTIGCILSSYASLGLLDSGIKMHELARKRGFISYPIVGNMLIYMYSRCKRIDKALEVFKRMREKNLITWSSMIHGYRINNKSFDALNLMRQMLEFDEQPNDVILVVALSACSRLGALICGKEIHAYALKNHMELDGYLPNALLDMYVKCGEKKHADVQFKLHKNKDVASWNILLSGYTKKGEGSVALQTFHKMIEAGVGVDEVTFILLLCALSKSGMVQEGREYFERMSMFFSITPNLKHYACMVDLLGRAGHLEEAYQFIQEMPIKPDAAIWGALLNACRIHRQVDLGEFAAQFILQLDSQSIGYYVLLCKLYAEVERWGDVARVRKSMREKGVFVDPGCSWVEVKGTVHAFLSGDDSHPQIKEINGVLKNMHEKMKSEGENSSGNSYSDEVELSKAEIFCGHSELPAVGLALINTTPGAPVTVTKNLYMCGTCHSVIKFISKTVRREITVRDTQRFHHFKDGVCSCGDQGYWGARYTAKF